MSLFGEQSDWSTLVAVWSTAIGCVLFVINQVGGSKKDLEAQILALRKEVEEKISGVKKNLTRVEDETTRKIDTTHARINKAEDNIKDNHNYVMDQVMKMKDQLIDLFKSNK